MANFNVNSKFLFFRCGFFTGGRLVFNLFAVLNSKQLEKKTQEAVKKGLLGFYMNCFLLILFAEVGRPDLGLERWTEMSSRVVTSPGCSKPLLLNAS